MRDLASRINKFLWFHGNSYDSGENFATKYLRRRGYKILCQNYRVNFGEIDIIAETKDTLVFVEVKQRKSVKFGLPREAVGSVKQSKICRTAEMYLVKNKTDKKIRFDVVEVYGTCDGVQKPGIQHIENAFRR
ncbi:MAG: YraN family protein [Bacillota bacterium]|nr:YraN family protein [Bacillota bacterium]